MTDISRTAVERDVKSMRALSHHILTCFRADRVDAENVVRVAKVMEALLARVEELEGFTEYARSDLQPNAVTVGPLPRQHGQNLGWKLLPDLLLEMQQEVTNGGWDTCMEVVEIVALAAERHILSALTPAPVTVDRERLVQIIVEDRAVDNWFAKSCDYELADKILSSFFTPAPSEQPESGALANGLLFLNNLQGESGLSAKDVDRLCGILNGRTDIELRPLTNYDPETDQPEPDAVQEAARVLLDDFGKIGCQRSPGPKAAWQDAFHAMNKERFECGWNDWPSIFDAALRALSGKAND